MRERYRVFSLQNRESSIQYKDYSFDNLKRRAMLVQELPQLTQNKMQMANYTTQMKTEQKSKYEQLSLKILREPYRNINVKQRLKNNLQSLHQKLEDNIAQYCLQTIFQNSENTIIKGIVMQPPQNEQQYVIPGCRQGSRVIKYNHNALLFGGYSHRENVDIHAISLLSGQWKRKQEFQEGIIEQLRIRQILNPQLRLGCYFSLNIDENLTIYAFGGERNNNGRKTTNTLTKINLENLEWQQHQITIDTRRNHSATYLHNHLIIIGGLDDSEITTKFYNDFHLIHLPTMTCTPFYPKYSLKDNQNDQFPFKFGLAYHQTVLVGNPQLRLNYEYIKKEEQVEKYTKEGIYIFGGKDSEDNLYNELYLLILDYYPSVLQYIETFGQKPQPRRSHSMNYDEKISAIIIFGGTDEVQCFGDLYLFFLKNYNWQKVQLTGYLEYPYRFEHCTVYNEDKLLIFGGLNQNGFLLYNPIQIQIKFKTIRKHI